MLRVHDFRLRCYSPQDLPSLLDLEKTISAISCLPWNAEQIAIMASQPENAIFLLSQPDCLAAYGLFRFDSSGPCARMTTSCLGMRILRLVVDPRFRRRQMGRWLIEAAERYLIRQHLAHAENPRDGLIQSQAIVPDILTPVHLFLRKLQFKAQSVLHAPAGDRYAFYRLTSWECDATGTFLRPLNSVVLPLDQPSRQRRHDQIG